MHDQGGLDTHHGAVAAVHPLHLSGDQTIRHVAGASTAVTFDRRAQDSQFSHLTDNLTVKVFVPVGHENAWHELLLAVGTEGVPDHDLLLRQEAVHVQGVPPVERHHGFLRLLNDFFGISLCWCGGALCSGGRDCSTLLCVGEQASHSTSESHGGAFCQIIIFKISH